jgi:hypothetical protein
MGKRFRFIHPPYLVLFGFARNGSPNLPIVAGIVAFGVLQATLVFGGVYLDNTWRLAGNDRGLLDHYGEWAILSTDPLLLIAAAYAYRRFRIAMSTLPLAEGGKNRTEVHKILKPFLDILHLKGGSLYVYFLLILVGFLSWLNNLYQTSNPRKFFGNEVFDSTSFVYGYYANKFVLFNSWVLIYPLVGFFLVSMSFATRSVLVTVKRNKLIKPTVTHPDACYGLSNLGALNVCLLFPYLLAFITVYAIMETHQRTYPSLIIPLVALTAVFLSASFVTIKPILSQAKEVQRDLYKRLASESPCFGRMGEYSDLLFGIDRLCFSLSNKSPYSAAASASLLVMRVIPIATTVLKFPIATTALKSLWP